MSSNMKLLTSLILASTVFLTACGGSGDQSKPKVETIPNIEGHVYGSIENAIVYLDLNFNGEKDINEPNTKSNSDGNFSLKITDKSCRDYAPIRVFVPYGAIDHHNLKETITERTFTLSFPPLALAKANQSGTQNITPFTTEVWELTEAHFTVSENGMLDCKRLNEESFFESVESELIKHENNLVLNDLRSNQRKDLYLNPLKTQNRDHLWAAVQKTHLRQELETDKNLAKEHYGFSDFVKVFYGEDFQLNPRFKLQPNMDYKVVVRSRKGIEEITVTEKDSGLLSFEGEVVDFYNDEFTYHYQANALFNHEDGVHNCEIIEKGYSHDEEKKTFEKHYFDDKDFAISLQGCQSKNMLDIMTKQVITIDAPNAYKDGDFQIMYRFDGTENKNAVIPADYFFYNTIELLDFEAVFDPLIENITIDMTSQEDLEQTVSTRTWIANDKSEIISNTQGKEVSFTTDHAYKYVIWSKVKANGEVWCRKPEANFTLPNEWKIEDNWELYHDQKYGCPSGNYNWRERD